MHLIAYGMSHTFEGTILYGLEFSQLFFPLKNLMLHEMNHFYFPYEGPSMKSEGTKFCVCIV